MITKKGTSFLVVAVAVFVLARVTQVGWLFLVDAFLWGILLLSAALPWLCSAWMTAGRRVEFPGLAPGHPGPSEGDQVRIELSLHNRAFWSRFVFSLFYDCPLAKPGSCLRRFFVTQLASSSQVTMVSEVEAYQRGVHHLGPVMIEFSAPFGLFLRRLRLAGPQPVLVCPKIYPLGRLAVADELLGAAAQSNRSPRGMDPAGSRQYFPGDPPRYIHWRNTARTGRPMVKEFDDSSERTLYLLFDSAQVWGKGRETTLEYGIKVVASAADYARRNRVPVRLWGGRLRLETPDTGRSGFTMWPELLGRLASVAPGDTPDLAELLRGVPRGANVLVSVSIANQRAVKAIIAGAPIFRRLVVVALHGFGEPEPDHGALRQLEMAQVAVIPCAPGQLPDALRALERQSQTPFHGLGFGGPGVVRPHQDAQAGRTVADSSPVRDLV